MHTFCEERKDCVFTKIKNRPVHGGARFNPKVWVAEAGKSL